MGKPKDRPVPEFCNELGCHERVWRKRSYKCRPHYDAEIERWQRQWTSWASELAIHDQRKASKQSALIGWCNG